MAKKTGKKADSKRKAKAENPGIDESALTPGQLRKLTALRKSVGDNLGERTFSEWLKQQEAKAPTVPVDKNAELIAEALMKLVETKRLRFPREGYLVSRGRGRVIVKRPESA